MNNGDSLVGGQGVADQDLFRPRMPEVDVVDMPEVIEAVFNTARKTASGEAKLPGAGGDDRHVILVTPRRMLMQVPCPPAGSIPPDQAAPMERMVPATVKKTSR